MSAGVHLLAILLYSFSGTPDPSGVTVAPPNASESAAAGTRIVNIVAVAGDVVEPSDPIVEPEDEAPVDAPAHAGGGRVELGLDARSVRVGGDVGLEFRSGPLCVEDRI